MKLIANNSQVRGNDPSARKAKSDPIRDAAKLYEKQFLREMVKAMRKTVSNSELVKKNMAEKIFQEKLDHEYVDSWGEQGGIGLADLIHQQLTERFGNKGKVPLKRGMIPLPQSELQKMRSQSDGVQFELKNKSSGPQPLKNPMPGKVEGAFLLPDGKQLLRVRHPGDVRSEFVFSGSTKGIEKGQEVSAASVLGTVSGGSGSVIWNLRDVT